MRRVIAFVVVAAAAIAFFWWLMALPGSFTLVVGDTTLNAPAPVAILSAIVLFIVLYVLIRLIALVIRLPSRTRRMQAARDRTSGEAAVTRTLLALAGSDGELAREEARRSRKLLGDTPQTLLLAAYAGRQAGQQEEADAAFRQLAERKDAAFLGLRGLMQGAIARGDTAAALALSNRAQEAAPNAPWLRTERLRLAVRSESWKEALALAGPKDPVAALGTAAAEAESDPTQARRLAKRAWEADSGFVPAAITYARLLRDSGREAAAQGVLKIAWRRNPHPELAAMAMAGERPGDSRRRRASTLAAENPQHPESYLMLAGAALDAGALTDARQYAQQAVEDPQTRRRAWRLIAAVAERNDDQALRNEAVRRAGEADADPVWRCSVCGTAHRTWHAVCDACATTGSLQWTGDAPGSQPGARLLAADKTDAILP